MVVLTCVAPRLLNSDGGPGHDICCTQDTSACAHAENEGCTGREGQQERRGWARNHQISVPAHRGLGAAGTVCSPMWRDDGDAGERCWAEGLGGHGGGRVTAYRDSSSVGVPPPHPPFTTSRHIISPTFPQRLQPGEAYVTAIASWAGSVTSTRDSYYLGWGRRGRPPLPEQKGVRAPGADRSATRRPSRRGRWV